MDASHFDRISRLFIGPSPRRGLLRGLAGAALGLAAARLPAMVDAKKKQKSKRKKLSLSSYSCLNVG